MKNLKWIISLSLICLVFVFLGAFSPSFVYEVSADTELSGEGTEIDPYLIADFEDLETFRTNINSVEDLTSYYRLTNNIAVTDEDWIPIGTEENPFSGHFDGNGKEISGVSITYDSNSDTTCLGLFGYIENAEITQLAVDIDISLEDDGAVLDPVKIGGIAGIAINSTISNCKINFSLSATRYVVTEDTAIDLTKTYYTRIVTNGSYVYTEVDISYAVTEDETLDLTKTYYTRSEISGSYIYTKVDISYAGTEDTAIDPTKTYYTISEDEGEYFYTEVEITDVGDIENYYELITPNIEDIENYYELITPDIEEIGNYYEVSETGKNEYVGEVVCGGAVGYAQALQISKCSVTTKIQLNQTGTNVVNSSFGGVVGQMDGGEMSFVYVSPSEILTARISEKNGNLTAVAPSNTDVILYNTKTSSSIIAFGGLIGYAQNINLRVYNSFYSSLFSATSNTINNKILSGGIVGRVSNNVSNQPQYIEYCKYLNIINANFSSFSGAVGNSQSAGYITDSTNISFTAMPTVTFYTQDSWKSSKEWKFETVWRKPSAGSTSNFFFPNLQCFSTFTISLSQNYVVLNDDEGYNSGYITLNFATFANDKYTLIQDREKVFYAGEEIYILAKFYNGGNNSLTDFKNYYSFTNWVKDGNSIGLTNGLNSNGYLSTEYSTEIEALDVRVAVLKFTAAAETEGIFGVGIIGKPVEVTISLAVEGENDPEAGFGSVENTIGTLKTIYDSLFSIDFANYQGGLASILKAINAEDSSYIFSKWQDDNSTLNVSNTKDITIELDNTRDTTLSRFYPKVVYETATEKLVAEITCYFSNNTSELTWNLVGNGGIKINDGELITESDSENVVNNRDINLEAVADEGYSFDGWYVSGIKVSSETIYTVSIDDAQTVEVRFIQIGTGATAGLSGWIIAIIVISSVLFVGLIVLIIFKIKRNSMSSYKRNYRY